MKKIYLYIIIISCMARPVYYFGQVAYYELNIDYIIENYCVNKDKPQLKCNGKCHLKKQLNVVANTNTTDKNTKVVLNVAASFYPLYYSTYPKVLFQTALFINTIKQSFYYNKDYIFILVNKQMRPPIRF